MTTNPNNAVGTNGAYSGRTSPNAFNDVLAIMGGRGVVSGWVCSPDSGMDVTIGGSGSVRDVAVAEDNAGNRVTVNNISQAPISLTIPAAPASNSRIDAIVAYVENPPMGTSTDTDNPGPVGLIIVSGAVASTPTVPDDNTIRTAITADGAAGATAYYVILATVTVANGTTTITSGVINAGASATIGTQNIADNAITSAKIASGAITNAKLGSQSVKASNVDLSTFGKVLYNDVSGTNGTVNLNDDTQNYDYIEIYYRDADNDYSYVKVYSPYNKQVCLTANRVGSGALWVKTATHAIGHTAIGSSIFGSCQVTEGFSFDATNPIYIMRVVGYKNVL